MEAVDGTGSAVGRVESSQGSTTQIVSDDKAPTFAYTIDHVALHR
jgi:hypothetical protein